MLGKGDGPLSQKNEIAILNRTSIVLSNLDLDAYIPKIRSTLSTFEADEAAFLSSVLDGKKVEQYTGRIFFDFKFFQKFKLDQILTTKNSLSILKLLLHEEGAPKLFWALFVAAPDEETLDIFEPTDRVSSVKKCGSSIVTTRVCNCLQGIKLYLTQYYQKNLSMNFVRLMMGQSFLH